MQTSFMHPPFGFALFYLRGISDTLHKNGALPAPVESKDIYLGAIPWVIMQLVLVVIVIFVPETVTMFLDKEQKVDLDQVTIEMPAQDDANAQEESAEKPSAEDEQKKMEELFNVKK
jgi:hypothetical protein